MKIDYINVNGYQIPNLELEPKNMYLGKYGYLKLQYIKENNRSIIYELLTEKNLFNYLVEINRQAMDEFYLIMDRLIIENKLNEEIKKEDSLIWTNEMNKIRDIAHEIVVNKYIYGEDIKN